MTPGFPLRRSWVGHAGTDLAGETLVWRHDPSRDQHRSHQPAPEPGRVRVRQPLLHVALPIVPSGTKRPGKTERPPVPRDTQEIIMSPQSAPTPTARTEIRLGARAPHPAPPATNRHTAGPGARIDETAQTPAPGRGHDAPVLAAVKVVRPVGRSTLTAAPGRQIPQLPGAGGMSMIDWEPLHRWGAARHLREGPPAYPSPAAPQPEASWLPGKRGGPSVACPASGLDAVEPGVSDQECQLHKAAHQGRDVAGR